MKGGTPQGSTAIWISSELSILWNNMTHWSWFNFVSDYFPGSSCIMKVVGVCHCRLSTITLTSDIFSAICNPLLSVYSWGWLLSLLWILWVPQSLVWIHLISTWWFSAYTCQLALSLLVKSSFCKEAFKLLTINHCFLMAWILVLFPIHVSESINKCGCVKKRGPLVLSTHLLVSPQKKSKRASCQSAMRR